MFKKRYAVDCMPNFFGIEINSFKDEEPDLMEVELTLFTERNF